MSSVIRGRRSIDIQASPDAVFALVLDLKRRLGLLPDAKVIGVKQETPGPIGLDTVFHIQLRTQDQPIDYRCRCSAFEPGHVFETTSRTDLPFGMRVTVEPTPDGSRLIQEEWLTVEYEKPDRPQSKAGFGKLLDALADGLSGRTLEDQRYHNATLEEDIGRRLEQWLKVTKKHLEDH